MKRKERRHRRRFTGKPSEIEPNPFLSDPLGTQEPEEIGFHPLKPVKGTGSLGQQIGDPVTKMSSTDDPVEITRSFVIS